MIRQLLYKGKLILPDEVIENGSILIEEGRISKIFRGKPHENIPGPLQFMDCYGMTVMPGMIDLHTDALDLEISPRPGANFPISIAFREFERKMSGHGFTTVFHALPLGYGEPEEGAGYSRAHVIRSAYEASKGTTLIQNRIHIRFEITGPYAYDDCMQLIHEGRMDLLSIMDHTPGQGQFGEERFIQYMQKEGKSEEEAKQILADRQASPKVSIEQIGKLVEAATAKGIAVASHDDDTPEKVELMYKLGVRICEFPINVETAQYARKKGMHIIGGAANVLRGGSLSGNMDVFKTASEGLIDSLCSDYYPPSMLHSIYKFVKEGGMDWSEAVNMVSLEPAKASRIEKEHGSLEEGKMADLMIVQEVEGIPLVAYTLVGGYPVAKARISPHRLDLTIQ